MPLVGRTNASVRFAIRIVGAGTLTIAANRIECIVEYVPSTLGACWALAVVVATLRAGGRRAEQVVQTEQRARAMLVFDAGLADSAFVGKKVPAFVRSVTFAPGTPSARVCGPNQRLTSPLCGRLAITTQRDRDRCLIAVAAPGAIRLAPPTTPQCTRRFDPESTDRTRS